MDSIDAAALSAGDSSPPAVATPIAMKAKQEPQCEESHETGSKLRPPSRRPQRQAKHEMASDDETFGVLTCTEAPKRRRLARKTTNSDADPQDNLTMEKIEAKEETKDEVKEEVEVNEGDEGIIGAKAEVKDEKEDVTVVKPGLKQEVHGNSVKAEAPLVKKEIKEEPGRRLRVKQEVKEEETDPGKRGVKRELLEQTGGSARQGGVGRMGYAVRLPLWIQQCLDFQKSGQTWTPAKPCCLPCNFLDPPAPPPKQDSPKSCFHRLTKGQRHAFRAFVESKEAAKIQAERQPMAGVMGAHWKKLLHPESQKRKKPAMAAAGGKRTRTLVTPPEWKPWPWMRDLPVRWWVGRGWTQSENGPQRVPTGCSTPGARIFRGRGRAVAKPGSDAPTAAPQGGDQPSRRGSSSGGPTPCAAQASAVTTDRRIVGVSWSGPEAAWKIYALHRSGRARIWRFPIPKYLNGNNSWEEAKASALKAAVARRKELVEAGEIKAAKDEGQVKVRPEENPSGQRGVTWDRRGEGWLVRFAPQIGDKRKFISGGLFKPRDSSAAELERTRLLAIEKYWAIAGSRGTSSVIKQDSNPSSFVARSSGVRGVFWMKYQRCWRAQFTKGRRRHRAFYPDDANDDVAVERARVAAVEWLQHPKHNSW